MLAAQNPTTQFPKVLKSKMKENNLEATADRLSCGDTYAHSSVAWSAAAP